MKLAFRHPLLREAADESIPPSARRGWHRRWAEVIAANPGVLAASAAAIAVAQHWARTSARPSMPRCGRLLVAGEFDLHEVEAEMWERVLDLWDGATPLPGLQAYNRRDPRAASGTPPGSWPSPPRPQRDHWARHRAEPAGNAAPLGRTR